MVGDGKLPVCGRVATTGTVSGHEVKMDQSGHKAQIVSTAPFALTPDDGDDERLRRVDRAREQTRSVGDWWLDESESGGV